MPGDSSNEGSTGGQVLGAASIGGGEVLGATTDVLGATGAIQEMVAIAFSLVGSMASYVVYKKTVR